MKPESQMGERLRSHLSDSNLFGSARRVLVGYSGGADSTCLMVLLQELGFEVVGAHLNHGLRPEGEQERDLCASACEKWGVSCLVADAKVGDIAKDLKL
nr:7-cyano-7-deazaguanine synthase [Fimbriimonadaceae bacterium]